MAQTLFFDYYCLSYFASIILLNSIKRGVDTRQGAMRMLVLPKLPGFSILSL